MKVIITVDIDPGSPGVVQDPEYAEDEAREIEGAIVDACGSVEMNDAIGEAIAESSGYVMEAVNVLDVKASRR